MADAELSSYQVIALDYSTLIDWETSMGDALVAYLEDIPTPPDSPVSSPTLTARFADNVPTAVTASVEYSDGECGDFRPDPVPGSHHLLRRFLSHEASVRREQDFLQYEIVFEQSHYRLMAQDLKLHNSTTVSACRNFTDSIFGRWEPFPDTIDALHRLQALGTYKLLLLSNLEEQTVRGRTLAGPLEPVASAFSGVYCAAGKATFGLTSVKEFDGVMARVVADNADAKLLYVGRGLKHDLLGRHDAGLVSVRGEEAVDVIAADLFKDSGRPAWRFPTLSHFVEACETSIADGKR